MHNDSFFYLALVYLAAAVVAVPLARKLGLVSVLGYLFAGVVIGPFIFGLIGEEGEDIMQFAEFGVVMMLFVIGLELKPALLWKLRLSILGMGGVQVIATSLVIFGIAELFGMPWQSGLALGLTLALSSTALVLQMFKEKGTLDSSSGQGSFSVLLFQDIAVIPILALFPLLIIASPAISGHELSHTWVEGMPGWQQTGIMMAAVILIVIGGRYLVPPLFRVIARTGMRELFTAMVLLLVISIAMLMSNVGLSPALGTFLAGVVLANSEYRHELESDIDPFKGLLLAVFFISVGASIDFNLVSESPWLLLGMVGILILIKAIILFVIGKVFGMGLDQNLIFSLSLAQGGEFGFVLLSFASQNGIMPPETSSMIVAVITLSMAMTPLIILFNEKVLLPRIGTKAKHEERKPDSIEEKNKVIIAGFGHFGSTVGRMLRANGIEPTVLDYDSDRVNALRKMGFNVYYGDASRYDMLKTAGAAEAEMIIIAIDNPDVVLQLVETVKKHFPDLYILARARNRVDAYGLMDAGLLHIYRESIDTSIRMGQDALHILGFGAHKVHRAGKIFYQMDEHHLKELASLRHDDKQYISRTRDMIHDLEEMIKADQEDAQREQDHGWDVESLREEVRSRYNPKK